MGYSVRHYGRPRTKKNGKKYKDWYVIVSLDGKEIEHKRAVPNTEAGAKALKIAMQTNLHLYTNKSLTFAEVAGQYMAYLKGRVSGRNSDRAEGTYKNYRGKLDNYLLPRFGPVRLTEIPPFLPSYIDELKTHLAANTVRTVGAVIYNVFSHAHKRLGFPDLLASVHLDLPPKKIRGDDDRMSYDEFRHLVSYTDRRPPSLPMLEWMQGSFMVFLGGLMGLRIGEMLGLDFEDIDLDGWRLHIRRQVVSQNGDQLGRASTTACAR